MPENAWVELFIVESSSSHNFTYGWRLSNRIFANDLILLTKGEIIYSISTSSFIPSTKYYPCKKNIN